MTKSKLSYQTQQRLLMYRYYTLSVILGLMLLVGGIGVLYGLYRLQYVVYNLMILR